MSELHERLKQIRLAVGMTQEEFSDFIGVTQRSWSRYELGQTVPDAGLIAKICKSGKIDPAWLLFGGEKKQEEAPQPKILPEGSIYKSAIKMVPMVKARLSAGGGSFEVCEDVESYFAFRSDFLKQHGNPNQMVLMTAAGHSQMPFIWNGDMVLIDKSQQELRPGDMYAVGIEDLVYLKRIDTQPGKLILSSYNKAYPPFEVSTSEDTASLITIMGRMIWSCHVW